MDKENKRLDGGVNVDGEVKYGHDQSINWSHRQDILTTDNDSTITRFFGDIYENDGSFLVSGKETTQGGSSDWTPGNNKAKLMISKTEKLIILFAAKHASAFLNDLLLKKLYTKKPLSDGITDFMFEPFSSKINTSHHNYDKLGVENAKEFLNLTKDKSKLDLIVVVRNPVYKLLSGLLQDLQNQINSNYVLSGLVKSQFDVEFHNETDIGELPPKVVSELLYKYVMELFTQTGSLKSTHSTLLNEVTYNLLEEYPNIPKNKLKIIDIDDINSNLGDTISMYHDEINSNWQKNLFKSHRPKWIPLLKSLEKVVKEKNDWNSFIKILKNYCYQDYFYYLKLKEKYKECFFTTNDK